MTEKPIHILDLSQSLIAIGWREQFRELLEIMTKAGHSRNSVELFVDGLYFYCQLAKETRAEILAAIPGSSWRFCGN
ncbi:MAG: hypothetical protein V2A63_03855 [Patescibacteria group bacterium]